jgi:hypothetical protein
VTAVIAAHLGAAQSEKARQYAAHLASAGNRVGMIEIDACEFRLSSFERGAAAGPEHIEQPQASTYFQPRHLSDALEELNCDVDQWVLLVLNPRLPEARPLLRDVSRWVLISTADHDGVIACYRSLKGLAEIARPRLSVAVVDSTGPDDAERVCNRLASVCAQFLEWRSEKGIAINAAADVVEHVAICWNPTRDKAQLANAPQWQIVADFLSRAKAQAPGPTIQSEPAASPIENVDVEPESEQTVHLEGPSMTEPSDVIELPDGDDAAEAVLQSIMRSAGSEMIECPVAPPGASEARLAVTRDRRLMLVAVAHHGLSNIASISQSYRWLIENRSLIGMALPQMTIDTRQLPLLRLLVDHADLRAESLQGIVQIGSVTVQSYRKLRWGERRGLLLEAA